MPMRETSMTPRPKSMDGGEARVCTRCFRKREQAVVGGAASDALADQCPQRREVDDFHRPTGHLHEPFFLESRKKPAYRFELQSKVTADFLAGHAQHEFGRGVATGLVALGAVS